MLCERRLGGVHVMEGKRKVIRGDGSKHQVHLLQIAMFLFRCLSCSAAAYCCIHDFCRALGSFKVEGVKNERRLLLVLLLSLYSFFRIIF